MADDRLGNVATHVRALVLERDGSCCRVCGRYTEDPGLHHIRYRSEGGPDTVDNLITVGWMPWHDCHLGVVHSGPKSLWQPILEYVVAHGGTTALSVIRWLDGGTLDPEWVGLDSWDPAMLTRRPVYY